jgi:small subunit ribosomal protein S20
MPNTKSAKKRHKQSLVRRQRNRAAKSILKSQVRKVRESVAAGEADKAAEELRLTTKKLDKTAARGIIHRNVAARLKSRLSAAVKKAKGGPSAVAEKPAKAEKPVKAKAEKPAKAKAEKPAKAKK